VTKRSKKPVKQAPLAKDDLERIRGYVRTRLRAGFDSLADVKKQLKDLDPEELFDEGVITAERLRAELASALETELAAFQRDTKKWPKQTDNDRLDAAFADLEEHFAVVARQDYWCCQTCGCAAIGDELAATRKGKKGEKGKKPPGALGYVFFHNQDTEAAVDGGGLFLAYGSADIVDDRTRAVGEIVVSVLRRHELAPEWDGNIATRIMLPIDWRRRLPKRSVARP
jgi:hypothetical protein